MQGKDTQMHDSGKMTVYWHTHATNNQRTINTGQNWDVPAGKNTDQAGLLLD